MGVEATHFLRRKTFLKPDGCFWVLAPETSKYRCFRGVWGSKTPKIRLGGPCNLDVARSNFKNKVGIGKTKTSSMRLSLRVFEMDRRYSRNNFCENRCFDHPKGTKSAHLEGFWGSKVDFAEDQIFSKNGSYHEIFDANARNEMR